MNGKDICLEMFLGMIPKDILSPFHSQSDFLRKNATNINRMPLNGKMRYSKVFDEAYSSNSAPVYQGLCIQMEVDDISSENDAKSEISVHEYSCIPKENFRHAASKYLPEKEEQASSKSKTLRVECLQSTESLKLLCKNQGLIFNDLSECDSQSVYEVDMICDHKVDNDEQLFLVKWKNYPTSSNTWEPEEHLVGCREAIDYFLMFKSPEIKLDKKILEYFIRDVTYRKPYDILILTKLCALCSNCMEDYVNSLKLNMYQLRRKVKEILNFHSNKIYKINQKLLEIMKFSESRRHILLNLQEWEQEINSSNKTAYIQVENNVDLEKAPSNFHFIHDYINRAVNIPEEPVAFCRCENCFQEKKECCPHDSEGLFAYSKHRRLLLQPGYPIYECNKLCSCDNTCINRLVQHGQKVKVAIFRTSSGCGWGLKTLETIEKGQFVLEYLGEIITSEEAEIRGHEYDYVGRSYLFDLDYSTDNCFYTVDAGVYGNVAHFINHSCDPNLHVFAVWINQPDPNLPRLAFFAKKKIRRGEELTFDYKMVKKDRFSSENPLPEKERIQCLCKSRNCRKFLF